MLRTVTYFTDFETPDNYVRLPREGSMACVWELPVINHERAAWVRHILQQATQPDWEAYRQDQLDGMV